MYIYTI